MRQYSIDRIEISWNGIDLKPGLAQGTSITEARNADDFTLKPTGQNKVVRVYNPDNSGSLSIVLDPESNEHKQMRRALQQDRLTRDQVAPCVVRDNSSGEVFTFKNTSIGKEPDETRGTESGTATWVLLFEDSDKTAPLDDANAIGN